MVLNYITDTTGPFFITEKLLRNRRYARGFLEIPGFHVTSYIREWVSSKKKYSHQSELMFTLCVSFELGSVFTTHAAQG